MVHPNQPSHRHPVRTATLALAVLLLAATLSTGSRTATAAEVRLGGVLPGGGTLTKTVLSVTERRYQNLIRQHTDFSCGAAALATVLRYAYQLPVDEDQVLRGLLAVSDPDVVRRRGFSLLNMKHYLDLWDLRGQGYRVDAATLEKLKVPTVVLLDLKGYKHFVVLKKVADGKAYLADPALGNKIMDVAAFEQAWNGIVFAVIGPGFERDSVLLRPEPPVTARSLTDTYAPVTDAQLLGMGFQRTELF